MCKIYQCTIKLYEITKSLTTAANRCYLVFLVTPTREFRHKTIRLTKHCSHSQKMAKSASICEIKMSAITSPD